MLCLVSVISNVFITEEYIMKFLTKLLLLLSVSSLSLRSEPITLSILGGTAVVTVAAVKLGAHCPAVCTRTSCGWDEELIIPPDFSNDLEKKVQSRLQKILHSNHGVAQFCAATCNSGTENIRIGTVSISVKKLYNSFTTLRNCMAGYNDKLPSGSMRFNPGKSIAVFSKEELDQVMKFSKTNDLEGYFKWTQGKESIQPNLQWGLWDEI